MRYIDNLISLRKTCKYIERNVDIIGVDTEFIRKTTYYPILYLVQLSYFDKNINNYNILIIDVLKIKNITALLRIIHSKHIKKIFFSFSQDLDAFMYLMEGSFVNNVDDLQIMLEFCGYNSNIGYADCIKTIFGIEFKKDKCLQISNWGKRPLSKKQLEYAENDVYYLIDIYKELYNNMQQNDNYRYYASEIKHILKSKNEKYMIDNSWKKIKFNLHKKHVDYVLLLKELCKWREIEAIKLNKCRKLIISDEILEQFAINKPRTKNDLKLLYTWNKNLINVKKEYKDALLDIINNFIINYNNTYKDDIYYISEKGLPNKDIVNNIYTKIENIAEKQNISMTRCLSKMDIISILNKYEKKRTILYGWKFELFADIFKNIEK